MRRVEVESEALREVGYDRRRRILEIRFDGGGLYRYHDVPPDTHAGLMAAESLGQYFIAHIRDAGFRYERLE